MTEIGLLIDNIVVRIILNSTFMYPERPEEWKQPQHGPGSTYVSNISASQQDMDRLVRENERLKAGLEKEKFFNKLLDQELKEVKAGLVENAVHQRSRTSGGVSKGAFYTLLLATLAMAGFIGYTLYFNKQYHLFPGIAGAVADGDAVSETSNAQAVPPEEVPAASSPDGLTQPVTAQAGIPTETTAPVEVATTSNPEQPNNTDQQPQDVSGTAAGAGSAQPPVTPAPAQPAKSPTVPPASASRERATANPNNRETAPPAATAARPNNTRTTGNNPPDAAAPSKPTSAAATPATAPQAQPSAPPPVNRPVIGRYRVTSKANFYTSADENTLRSTFITPGPNRIVAAVEDRNGFILVSYRNDAGHVTNGWLSKKDLTEVK